MFPTTGTAKDIRSSLLHITLQRLMELKLSLPKFTARALCCETALGEIPEKTRPIVTVKLTINGACEKQRKISQDDNFYYTKYTIVVQNQLASTGGDSDYNRYGRLNMEKFKLRDILPTNTPAGGEAVDKPRILLLMVSLWDQVIIL